MPPTSRREADVDGPTIVKTKQFAVKPMDVEEAALQMELLGHDFFLFTAPRPAAPRCSTAAATAALGLIEAAG